MLPATILLKHDNYKTQTDEHDVALIKLAKTTILPTVKLNTGSDLSLLSTGRAYTTLSWSDLGNGTFPNILQEVQVDFMSNSACRNAPDPMGSATYLSNSYDDMMCAFANGKDGCQGDFGGPLLVEGSTPSDDIVVGVPSWGVGCARMPESIHESTTISNRKMHRPTLVVTTRPLVIPTHIETFVTILCHYQPRLLYFNHQQRHRLLFPTTRHRHEHRIPSVSTLWSGDPLAVRIHVVIFILTATYTSLLLLSFVLMLGIAL